jgi:hypothetical protein
MEFPARPWVLTDEALAHLRVKGLDPLPIHQSDSESVIGLEELLRAGARGADFTSDQPPTARSNAVGIEEKETVREAVAPRTGDWAELFDRAG